MENIPQRLPFAEDVHSHWALAVLLLQSTINLTKRSRSAKPFRFLPS